MCVESNGLSLYWLSAGLIVFKEEMDNIKSQLCQKYGYDDIDIVKLLLPDKNGTYSVKVLDVPDNYDDLPYDKLVAVRRRITDDRIDGNLFYDIVTNNIYLIKCYNIMEYINLNKTKN